MPDGQNVFDFFNGTPEDGEPMANCKDTERLIEAANNFANRSLTPAEHDVWKDIKAALKAKDKMLEGYRSRVDERDKRIAELEAALNAIADYQGCGHVYQLAEDALGDNDE